MANVTTEVIGTIGAIQTLIENFPMSIFAMLGNKIYRDPIEFVMDVLRQLGISDRVLVDKLIELFFGVPNAIEIYGDISNYKYELIQKPTDEQIVMAVPCAEIPSEITSIDPNYICVNDLYYVKKAPVPTELQSEFITGIEDSVKGIIQNILTGLLSCSVIPEIPDGLLDVGGQGFVLTQPAFDLFNMLQINPLSEIGKNYYSGVDDLSLTVYDLYKANDLNAFLWYVINRGNTVTTAERNKMLWDNRIAQEKDNEEEHPILQFEPTVGGVKLSFPISTWAAEPGEYFNKSIYSFNSDYLKNIQIFNPRIIITEMIDSLLNGNLLSALNPSYSIETKIFDAKLDEIIKQALEMEDITVDDCFYSFSNDEFNSALKNMELQKYSAKQLNSETSPAIKIDPNFGVDALNEINSMATMNEKLTSISKTVYDIAAIPAEDAAIEISDKFMLGYNEKWINDIVMALVRPLARAIFTPKVMLLYLTNFYIMGLVNFNDIQSLNDVLNLIIKKMIGIILSLVRYIKDKIIQFLLKLFFETIKPLLVKWGIIVLKEKLDDWIALLEEAMACIPLFDFSRYSVQTAIDDVNYADITQVQTTPETEKTC